MAWQGRYGLRLGPVVTRRSGLCGPRREPPRPPHGGPKPPLTWVTTRAGAPVTMTDVRLNSLRRLVRPVDWPYLAAIVLACAALVEVAARETGEPFIRAVGPLLALAATAPVALLRTLPVAATVLIAAVCVLSPLLGYQTPA